MSGYFWQKELSVYFISHSRDNAVPGGLLRIDKDLGWKLSSEKTAIHHTRYFDVVYVTNRFGFRDKPRKIVKDDKTYRILLYGDSQIFGWGILEEKRFSNLIETQRRDLEIRNLAVPGYGLDQEILSYKRDGKSLNADHVIFFVSAPTLSRIYAGYIYDKYKPMFEIGQDGSLRLISIPTGKSVMNSLLYQVLSSFYLPYFVERQLAALKEALNKSSYIRPRQDYTKTSEPPQLLGDFEKKMLSVAQSTVVERNQRMTVLTDLPQTTRKDLRNFCEQNGIGFLDIVLDDYKKEDLILGKDDRHWNLRANEIIAEQLLFQMESYSRTATGLGS
ncbi:MAG TPA: hypothetical protein VGW77_18125 [Candidatus Binatia bacterium]|nr:hypothetical protein [Candidatus Binatia bacterium]